MLNRVLFILLLIFVSGCREPQKESSESCWQEIYSRGYGNSERHPLYRVKIPLHWKRNDPTEETSLIDTKKELCEFAIGDGEGALRIVVHNFPSHSSEERIPPIAQVSRWKRQFDAIDPANQLVVPQSFSGYAGYLYEGKGSIRGEDKTIMGWALQIGQEHYRVLSRPGFPEEMRADVTIKATGRSKEVLKHRQEIIDFARSFELIEEIPPE